MVSLCVGFFVGLMLVCARCTSLSKHSTSKSFPLQNRARHTLFMPRILSYLSFSVIHRSIFTIITPNTDLACRKRGRKQLAVYCKAPGRRPAKGVPRCKYVQVGRSQGNGSKTTFKKKENSGSPSQACTTLLKPDHVFHSGFLFSFQAFMPSLASSLCACIAMTAPAQREAAS